MVSTDWHICRLCVRASVGAVRFSATWGWFSSPLQPQMYVANPHAPVQPAMVALLLLHRLFASAALTIFTMVLLLFAAPAHRHLCGVEVDPEWPQRTSRTCSCCKWRASPSACTPHGLLNLTFVGQPHLQRFPDHTTPPPPPLPHSITVCMSLRLLTPLTL